MRTKASHSWSLSPAEARQLQERLARRVILEDPPEAPETVAGVDVAFDKKAGVCYAAAVLLALPGLQIVETADARAPLTFPYVPGLLSFREGPVILRALGGLRRTPDLVLYDGQGLAHPRGFGLACHMGVVTDLPSIGVAKSRYVGHHEEPHGRKGAHVPLRLDGRQVGSVVRTRSGVRPVFVSPGHRVSLETAVAWTLSCCRATRLPVPTHEADRLVARVKARRDA